MMPRRTIVALLASVLSTACADAPAGDAARDARLASLVDSLLPSLATLSGLEARAPVRVAERSPAQVRAFVAHRLDADYPPGTVDGIREAYALLGLLPDTLDLRNLLAALYAEQIVGYYDPDSTTLYVTEGVARDALRPVLAHELVHALQDQHIDLDSLIALERGNDRQLAAQAAIEGHATLVMLAFLAGEATGSPVDPAALPDPSIQIRAGLAGADAYPVFRSAPPLLREVLIFPYADGAAFAWRTWASRPPGARPPLAALLPESTEQVLAPGQTYPEGRDVPTEIRLETVSDGRTLREDGFGAFETGLFLELRGRSRTEAAGWDGDRYRVLEDAQGRRALVWWSVWDDAASADTFADAARAALADGRAHTVERVEAGRPAVLIRIAGAGLDPASVSAGTLDCPVDGSVCTSR